MNQCRGTGIDGMLENAGWKDEVVIIIFVEVMCVETNVWVTMISMGIVHENRKSYGMDILRLIEFNSSRLTDDANVNFPQVDDAELHRSS